MTTTELGIFMSGRKLSGGQTKSLGLAIASMLREQFPHHTAKGVAKALPCTIGAAESLLNGHLSARTITMLIQAFGPGFVAEAVMAAAGTNLANYIRTQAEAARASEYRFKEQADELDEIEASIRARREARHQGDSRVGA